MIEIIAIGKKHEDWVENGISRYQKRLIGKWAINWHLLPHSKYEAQLARNEESTRILAALAPDDYVILLDERGRALDSPDLSTTLEYQLDTSRKVKLIIGGAYGVNEALIERADLVWSLSPLVFPHQLVRLILTEQLYRAQEIAKNSSYHHK